MFRRSLLLFALGLAVAMPGVSLGDPPDHAPAHGYRNKKQAKGDGETRPREERNDVEIVFDSERGVHVVVGFPGIFFEGGRYYRHEDGGWQVSAEIDSGWRAFASGSVPREIRATHAQPGPAKAKKGKK